MNTKHENPYRASALVIEPVVGNRPRPLPAIVFWVFVFLANLLTPVMFGTTVMNGFAGYMTLCAAGVIFFCGQRIRLVRHTSVGGILTAVSQFYPIFQLLSGTFAL